MASERALLRVWSWPKQCLFHQIKSIFEALSFLTNLNNGEDDPKLLL